MGFWQNLLAGIRKAPPPSSEKSGPPARAAQAPEVLPPEFAPSPMPRSLEEAQASVQGIADAVEHARKLHRLGLDGEEEKALWEMVKDTEREARREGWCPAPHAYERLAILYRKQKRFDDEIAILGRWLEKAGDQVNDDSEIRARIAKAQALRAKAEAKAAGSKTP